MQSPFSEKEQTKAVIAWLQLCYEKLEQGREDEIPSDPFYESERGPITDDYVNRVVEVTEGEFVYELEKNPAYHFRNADGATTPPEFTRLGPRGRRALVEGLDRVLGFQKKRD